MISITLTILILTSVVSGAPSRYQEPRIENHLHDEILDFARERLYRAIVFSHDAALHYLLISVTLTTSACDNHNNAPNISVESYQTIWEEKACGTENMQIWCYESPGRTITVMTKNEETDTSVLAQFRCEFPEPLEMTENGTDWTNLLTLLASISFILFVMYNFHKLCKEQAGKRKLTLVMKNVVESSMDTVKLDSSFKEKPKKELARFDDDSDPTLGTLFTI